MVHQAELLPRSTSMLTEHVARWYDEQTARPVGEATKLLLGLNRDSSAVERAAGLLGLNEQEAVYLASCRLVKGVGATALLLADGERTPLVIPMWPERLHQIVTGRSRRDEGHL
jgi:hypothetical protein